MYGNPNNFKVPRNFVANKTITRTGKQFPVGLTSNLPSLAWSGCCIGAVDLSFRQHFAFCKNDKSSSDKTVHSHCKLRKDTVYHTFSALSSKVPLLLDSTQHKIGCFRDCLDCKNSLFVE